MSEIRRCPVTGRFRAKGLDRSIGRSPEERSATKHARYITFALTVTFVAMLSVHVTEKILQLQQKAAMMQIPTPKPDPMLPLLQEEPGWTILSAPESDWIIHVKPQEKKPEKKLEKKPTVKPPEKPKPQPKPKKLEPKPVMQAVSGKRTAEPKEAGAVKTVDQSAVVLTQIIEVIERYKRYPERAKSLGIQDRILLKVSIAADGTVGSVELEKGGHPLLRRATLQAAKHLKGVKTQTNRAMILVVPVQYELRY